MKKRVFIIHGWGGSPNNDWIPWAKSQIENMECNVIAPQMPDTDNPQVKSWMDKLKQLVGQTKKRDILIGHSIGCQTIWRFLEKLPKDQKVDKVIMIAPWLKLTNLENKEAYTIAAPWLETPIDFAKVKSKANSFVAIFSDNDQFVPILENKIMIEKLLAPKIIVLNKKGHFTGEDGVKELPEVLNHLDFHASC